MYKNIWELLGIDQTDDVRAIKRAYARKVKHVHPEEFPEEFKRLNDAYHNALGYAKFRARYASKQDEDTSTTDVIIDPTSVIEKTVANKIKTLDFQDIIADYEKLQDVDDIKTELLEHFKAETAYEIKALIEFLSGDMLLSILDNKELSRTFLNNCIHLLRLIPKEKELKLCIVETIDKIKKKWNHDSEIRKLSTMRSLQFKRTNAVVSKKQNVWRLVLYVIAVVILLPIIFSYSGRAPKPKPPKVVIPVVPPKIDTESMTLSISLGGAEIADTKNAEKIKACLDNAYSIDVCFKETQILMDEVLYEKLMYVYKNKYNRILDSYNVSFRKIADNRLIMFEKFRIMLEPTFKTDSVSRFLISDVSIYNQMRNVYLESGESALEDALRVRLETVSPVFEAVVDSYDDR